MIGSPGNQCPFLGAFQNNGINIISGVVERGLLMNNKRQSFHAYAPEVTGMSLILLCFTDNVILQIESSSKSISTVFSNSICLFHSLSHFDNSRNISSFFIIIVFVLVICDQFSSVVSNSLQPHGLHAARQASLSITNSWSLLILMYIEAVMPSNYFILCRPLLLLPSIFPSIRVFSKESVLCIR